MRKRFGAFQSFKYSNAWHIPAIIALPVLRLVVLWVERSDDVMRDPGQSRSWMTWVAVGCWVVFSMGIHPAGVFLMVLTNTMAPDRSALGAMSGMSVSASCLGRIVGAPICSTLFAISVSKKIWGGQMW